MLPVALRFLLVLPTHPLVPLIIFGISVMGIVLHQLTLSIFMIPRVYYVTLVAINADGCTDTLTSQPQLNIGVSPQASFYDKRKPGLLTFARQLH
jgi:hypothetical protein